MTPDDNTTLDRFEVTTDRDLAPPIALGVWVLGDARRRTLGYLRGIDQTALDFQPHPGANTIGTLLYHLSATEMDWLHDDILLCEPPPTVQAHLPHPYHDGEGRLSRVVGVAADTHRERLASVQAILVANVSAMTIHDYQRPRTGPTGIFSAEWIVHHLAQHEAQHRGQIALLRRAAEQRAK